MTITTVNSGTILADTVNLIRDKLASNITDPITSSRPSGAKFVMTSYPRRPGTIYPLITVTDRGISDTKQGMASEVTIIRMGVEIRIWGRSVKERDELFDKVYDYLRKNQLDATTGLSDSNLHDFTLTSAVNISEEGEAGLQSKVLEIRFLILVNGWKEVNKLWQNI